MIEDLAGAGAWAESAWEWSCRGAWTRSTWAAERPGCWRRSCWRSCLPRCARSSSSTRTRRLPSSARRDRLRDATLEAMAAAGVNRVSLGVQSFIDREAHASGRLHNRATVEEDLRRLRAAGIANLNVDLIAGLAGQTFASWEESLAALVGLRRSSRQRVHARGGRGLAAGARSAGAAGRVITPGWCRATMRLRACTSGRSSGWKRRDCSQYEISNFCRPGFESRHNLALLAAAAVSGRGAGCVVDAACTGLAVRADRGPGHGLGRAETEIQSSGALAPVSSSVLRTTTTDDLSAYLAGTGARETQWLTAAQQHEEAWFLGLRTNAGVDVDALRAEFGEELLDPALETVARLATDELLVFDGARARLTARGRMISNEVFQEFLQPVVAESSRRA